jgi:pimeloyl-ACP methyl ester carboxylesterase
MSVKDSRNSRKWSVIKKCLIGLTSLMLIAAALMTWFVMSLFVEPDISDLPSYHPFKSAKAKEQYLNYYNSRAMQWPVASESKFVETSFGKTFVRISGPAGAPPLVLLPSASASSLIWLSNIRSLSRDYRVYAIDNIYDVGLSVYIRMLKQPEDFVSWLDEVFTGLGLEDNINLMGYSYGGWISSRYVLAHPERIHKMVLLAPAATVFPLPGEWAWRGILSAMPHRYFMKRFMVDWMFEDLVSRKDEDSRDKLNTLINDAMMGLRCFKMKMLVAPTVLTDKELEGIQVPTLFMVGEHEKIYSAIEAVKRLNSIAPQIKTVIVPNASHDLPISQTDLVDISILDFFDGD